MSKNIIVDDHTNYKQALASNPEHSAWVSANAGSGKTFVLARRVARLLLSGSDPSRILCLTFTKAAAGEMANRIFKTLSQWAIMDDANLEKEILALEGTKANKATLARARTLFARALETPGGLKIQTIHSFCVALLHQFPLEANVPGNFNTMDDAQQHDFIERARYSIIRESENQPHGPLGRAFSHLMHVATDHALEQTFDEIISKRDAIAHWLDQSQNVDSAMQALKQHLGFTNNETKESLEQALIEQLDWHKIDCLSLAAACAEIDQTGAQTLAKQFKTYTEAQTPAQKIKALTPIFLTSSGELRALSRYPSKPVINIRPDLKDIIAHDGPLLIKQQKRINTLQQITHSHALMVVAHELIKRYRLLKQQKGLLDHNDQIERAAELLTQKSARSWVLYKLDLGIDHLLLDEAQDTNPRQWQIISALVEEFFTGHSARALKRSVFAVGDEKQSIYSFQGSEPKNFSLQKHRYKQQADGAEHRLEAVSLDLSFRSTPDVLGAVDAVFALPENAKGLSYEMQQQAGNIQRHTAARRHDQGKVELWPLLLKNEATPPPDWPTPMEQSQNHHPAIELAEKIADRLHNTIGKERLAASGKIIGAGDIVILVRSRDRFIGALTRALKQRNIPVAGADRLILTNHIAVQDLTALGQIMLTPEDDLSLACVLKSPLIALNEEELYVLNRNRLHDKYQTSLFEALKQHSNTPPYDQAYQRLIAWQKGADAQPVYEFFAQVLGADQGRKQFYTRCGPEAEDVLDAFLSLTLNHEQTGLPGLQAFLEFLQQESPEIKREMEQASGQVRVMTVHAAKGLEAPIVYVVDKCAKAFQEQKGSKLYAIEEEQNQKGYLWTPSSAHHGHITLPLKDLEKEKAEEEHRRLLYVAMTRAEDQLIICGYGPKPSQKGEVKLPTPNWHTMVSQALSPQWQEIKNEQGTIAYYRWQISPFDASFHADEASFVPPPALPTPSSTSASSEFEQNPLPQWAHIALQKEKPLPRPLNPSRTQALIDETIIEEKHSPSLLPTDHKASSLSHNPTPQKRGTALHKLLQVLPQMLENDPDTCWLKAHDYLTKELPDYPLNAREAMVEGLRSVLTAPTLAPYFNPKNSRAEVPIMGKIKGIKAMQTISGSIDRLAVLEHEVMVLDYKTSLYVPSTLTDIPDDYINQMALYHVLVKRLYPEKTIKTALIWTHGTKGLKIHHLPDNILHTALQKIMS